MTSIHRARRVLVVLVATAAVIVTSLTIVPALAQGGGEEGPEPYVELMTGLTSEHQYIRLVDDDPATADPQQEFTSLAPWTLAEAPELVTVAAAADPQVVLAGTNCLDEGGEPIAALPEVQAAHYSLPNLGWIQALPLIGVTSYACYQGEVPQIVPEDSKATIMVGETLEITGGADLPLDFRGLKLSVRANQDSAIQVTAKLGGSVVGTIDVDVDVDCVDSTDWENEDTLCATRVVPFFGPIKMRYLNLDFGGPFDSFEMTSTAGTWRLKGQHPSKFFLDGELFGGTIGGGTGQQSVTEPRTDTLPGYTVACADAADPPPEGPCGGKEVTLSISRFLADLDEDGNVDQVLNVVPTGAPEESALLTLIIEWADEDAPTGAVPLSRFDEDDAGPDDDDPAAWCSVDPPGAPGDEWCQDTIDVASAGPGQIRVTDTYQGTGDPRAYR